MSLSNSAETNLLKLIFQNTTWAGIGDATGIVGSTTAGSLFNGLATSDPGEAGDQTSGEISYTGYTRETRARTSGGWTVTGNSVSPATIISFGAMTAGAGGTASFWTVGKSLTGTGELLYSGAISPTISVVNGVTPQLATGSAITMD